jgi:hypothetical protein
VDQPELDAARCRVGMMSNPDLREWQMASPYAAALLRSFERRSSAARQTRRASLRERLTNAGTLPFAVHREFIDMLYAMWFPIFGLGAVFVAICVLATFRLGEPLFGVLALSGAVTIMLRVVAIRRYARLAPVEDAKTLRQWERRYAAGTYISALLLALLNILALQAHDPLLHLITWRSPPSRLWPRSLSMPSMRIRTRCICRCSWSRRRW